MNAETETKFNQIIESMESIARTQPHAFDRICGKHSPIILYGAGHTGRELSLRMHEEYGERLFFTDRRENLWGGHLDGIPVLSPCEAAQQYGEDGVFVITVFNREPDCAYSAIVENLAELGALRCVPWALVAWKYADALLPRFFLGSAKDILPFKKEISQVFSSLHDQRSRTVFLEYLEASLTAPFERLSPRDDGPQYFIPEVMQRLPNQVCIVDCGAYDGDTLRDALTWLGAERISSYYAFEPDIQNFQRLEAFCDSLPQSLRNRVTCFHAAVGDKEGFVSLASEGTESAFVNGDAAKGIRCMTLDSVLADTHCDLLKMDIEGYEKEALHCASSYFKRDRTMLAISAYHKPDDFFSIPLCINSLCGGYGFFRKHYANLFDTVYYHI
jgi:FkbM family methyltransferase